MVRDHGLSQARAAGILGVTGAAVSQYLGGKRGEMVLTAKMKKESRRSAGKIVAGEAMAGELCRLCNLVKVSDMLPELYRKHDGSGSCPGGIGVKQ